MSNTHSTDIGNYEGYTCALTAETLGTQDFVMRQRVDEFKSFYINNEFVKPPLAYWHEERGVWAIQDGHNRAVALYELNRDALDQFYQKRVLPYSLSHLIDFDRAGNPYVRVIAEGTVQVITHCILLDVYHPPYGQHPHRSLYPIQQIRIEDQSAYLGLRKKTTNF